MTIQTKMVNWVRIRFERYFSFLLEKWGWEGRVFRYLGENLEILHREHDTNRAIKIEAICSRATKFVALNDGRCIQYCVHMWLKARAYNELKCGSTCIHMLRVGGVDVHTILYSKKMLVSKEKCLRICHAIATQM